MTIHPYTEPQIRDLFESLIEQMQEQGPARTVVITRIELCRLIATLKATHYPEDMP